MSVVSVIIPCYRQAHFLDQAIDSVLEQTYPDTEVIVVDDGSPDQTSEVVRRYPQVEYIVQANQGLAAARNRGIEASKGEYLVFLDADDHLLPNHFGASLRAFQLKPDAALVCGSYRLFGSIARDAQHNCDLLPDHFGTLLRWNFIGPPHVAMFKREVVSRLGGFRRGVQGCEDYDLYLRIAREHRIHCHHEVIAEYRRHESQMSQQWGLMLFSAVHVMKSQVEHLQRHPAYHEAYCTGLRQWQRAYGVPLVWQMIGNARSRKWGRAFKDLEVLLRCFPQGLLVPLKEKVRRMTRCSA
ncbi:MAG: glycosyltransferase [Nitrospirales bacterium]